jgi:hypothetical protein
MLPQLLLLLSGLLLLGAITHCSMVSSQLLGLSM